jgi:hypothetical protein
MGVITVRCLWFRFSLGKGKYAAMVVYTLGGLVQVPCETGNTSMVK